MTVIYVEPLNEVHMRVYSDDSGIESEICDYFTYDYPGAKWTPQYKARLWDGKVYLYNLIRKTLYVGLLEYVLKFAETRGYTVQGHETFGVQTQITYDQIEMFAKSLNLCARGQPIDIRDYQLNAVFTGLKNKRAVLLSPTGCLDPNTVIEVYLDDEGLNFIHDQRNNEQHEKANITLQELEQLISNNHKVKIETPTGPELITDTYRKHLPGKCIEFVSGDVMKCANTHRVWKDFNWVFASTLVPGDSVGGQVVSKITDVPKQDWIDFTVDAPHSSYLHQMMLHHNSGKSLILYVIIRWLLEQNLKIILIVPVTTLVEQMVSDFKDYSSSNGWDVESECQILYSGFSKEFTHNVLITTWQSVYTMPQVWFQQFDVVLGDECHQYKAQSLIKIMEKMVDVQYRFGTTGSLDDKKINQLTLQGIFGPIHRITSTKQLQDEGKLAKLKIKGIILKYPEDIRRNMVVIETASDGTKKRRMLTYHEEVALIIANSKRNKFISNLALACKGNTLVLFQFVEKHGEILYDLISQKAQERPVYIIHGDTDTGERENIRGQLSHQTNAIVVASVGTTSTGINIPSIQNIIFASPTKSVIRTLQSIGRGLRLHEGKTHCTLYDLTDDLHWKNKKNFLVKHGAERFKIYATEQFEIKLIEVDL